MYSDIFIQQVRSCSDNMRSNYKHGITEYHLCSSKQPHCLHVCQRLLLIYKYSRDPGFAPSVLGLDFMVLGYLIFRGHDSALSSCYPSVYVFRSS